MRTSLSGQFLFLLMTAIICGALIMVIEVLGSRVVGPFFGVSLFVWTSLISVTLLALAIGYAIGGFLSDKYPQTRYLYYFIFAAGVFTLAIPFIKVLVLKACMPMGLRAGAFMSTAILFGPPLIMLGCVSPYLAKTATEELSKLGRVVGSLYALSTLGSTVGTIATGFVLIAYMGVDNIFYMVGSMLILLSISYMLIFERKLWPLAGILVLFIVVPQQQPKVRVAEDGTRIEIKYHHNSYYGDLKVVDYSYKDRHIRELLIDGQAQGGIDMSNQLTFFDYIYYVQFLSKMNQPDGKSCLVIGMGLGIVPSWFEKQGIPCDVVDIDPTVFTVSMLFNPYDHKGQFYTDDARYYLSTTEKRYDYLILDVFNGEVTPSHLVSIEALALIKQKLSPIGVLTINLAGSLHTKTFMTASVIKTLSNVFDQVEIYPVTKLEGSDGVGNLIVLAYQGNARALTKLAPNLQQIHPRLEAKISENLGARFYFPENTPAIILTDDYNPIDFYDSWMREQIRKRAIESTNWDLLLS